MYNHFTNIQDINQLILLEMDIDSLSNYCQVNKSTNCNIQFWKKKFNHDQLYYNFLENYPTTLNEWIKTYKLLYQSKMDIKHLLLIAAVLGDEKFIMNESDDIVRLLDEDDIREIYSFKMNVNDGNQYIIKINGSKYIWDSEKAVKFLIAVRYYEYLRDEILIADQHNIPYLITNNNRFNYNGENDVIARYYVLESILFFEGDPRWLRNNWINENI